MGRGNSTLKATQLGSGRTGIQTHTIPASQTLSLATTATTLVLTPEVCLAHYLTSIRVDSKITFSAKLPWKPSPPS